MAKPYFEKSKLPVEDLRNIWELADTTEDGCLDLFEFQTAIHFVVLRKHGLPIPSDYYDYVSPETRRRIKKDRRRDRQRKLQKLTGPRCAIPNSSQISSGPSGSNGTTSNGFGALPALIQDQIPFTPTVNPTTPPANSVPSLAKVVTHNALPSTSQQKIPVPVGKINLRTIQKSSKGKVMKHSTFFLLSFVFQVGRKVYIMQFL